MFCRGCDYPLKALTEPRCPECGRGFDAGDARTFSHEHAWSTAKRWLLRIRLCLLPILLSWMFYTAWSFRCWDISQGLLLDAATLLGIASVIGGAPLILLLWLGCRPKHYILGVFLSLTIPLGFAEGLALYEEHWFVTQARNNPQQFGPVRGTEVYHNRWWPNGNSYLGYDTATGRFWGGD